MQIREYIEEVADCRELTAILLSSEFDTAIVGIHQKDDFLRVVYSEEKVIEALMDQLETDREGACEYFSFNMENSYVGPGTPLFIEDTFFGS